MSGQLSRWKIPVPALVAVGAAMIVLLAAKLVESELARSHRDKFAEDRLLILKGEGRLIAYRLAGRAQKLGSLQQALEKIHTGTPTDRPAIEQKLAEFLKADPGFNSLTVVSADGRILASAGEPPTTPPTEPGAMAAALSGPQTWISPIRDFGREAGLVFLCRLNLDEMTPAVLVARCPANWLLANLFTASSDNPGRKFIDHTSGRILVAGPDMVWTLETGRPDPESLQRSAPGSHYRENASGDIVLQHTVDVLSAEVYPASVAELASIWPMRWSVVQSVPSATITNFGRLSVSGMWFVAAVALMVIVPSAYYASRGWERVRKSREELERILSSLLHGIVAVRLDPASGDLKVTMANREAQRLLSGPGEPDAPRPDPALPPALAQWVRGVIASGNPGTTEQKLRDNPPLWALIRAARSDGGAVISMADVTRQKETENRLEASLEQEKELFRRAQAAAQAKRDFLAVMSHEIRTPLNGILGFAEILGRRGFQGEDGEAVDTIRQSGESLLQIINDVLDYSRMDAGHLKLEPVPVHLPDVVGFVTGLLKPAAQAKDVGIIHQIDPSVPAAVLLDPGRLKQILLNLVGNAVKFTPQGSVTIRIATEGKGPDGRILLRFSVIDTGIGIPEDHLAHIFEPFVQADASISRSHGGTGLGLAITRSLVQLMGGDLEVTSRPGSGSTFSFILPVETAVPVQPATDRAHPASWEHVRTNGAPINIIVAEDDRVNARLTRLLLTKLGYNPRLAADGEEAIRMTMEDPPDLILMDVHVPRVHGIEATLRIRSWEKETARPTPILIAAFTADVLPEDRAACLAAGMDDFLQKPLQSARLLAVLEKATRRAHADPPGPQLSPA